MGFSTQGMNIDICKLLTHRHFLALSVKGWLGLQCHMHVFSENYKDSTLLDNNDSSTDLQNILLRTTSWALSVTNLILVISDHLTLISLLPVDCWNVACSLIVFSPSFDHTTSLAGSSTSNNDVPLQCPVLFSVVTAYQATSSRLLSSKKHVCFVVLISQFNI